MVLIGKGPIQKWFGTELILWVVNKATVTGDCVVIYSAAGYKH